MAQDELVPFRLSTFNLQKRPDSSIQHTRCSPQVMVCQCAMLCTAGPLVDEYGCGNLIGTEKQNTLMVQSTTTRYCLLALAIASGGPDSY